MAGDPGEWKREMELKKEMEISNVIRSTVEEALTCLGIRYRKFPCRQGKLYFCTAAIADSAFNVRVGNDGAVRLWRFVEEVPPSEAGTRCEYHRPDMAHRVVGLEVTEEGDVSFFAEQVMDCNDSERVAHMIRMVKAYVSVICGLDMELKEEPLWKSGNSPSPDRQLRGEKNLQQILKATYVELFGSLSDHGR